MIIPIHLNAIGIFLNLVWSSNNSSPSMNWSWQTRSDSRTGLRTLTPPRFCSDCILFSMWNAQHNSEKVTLRYLQPYFSIDYLFRSINPHQEVFAISNSWTVFAGRPYVRHVCCYRQRTGTKCHLHASISVSVRRMTHQRSDRPGKNKP